MPTKFRRIHILGGPGSGKTFLARRLSRQLGVSFTNLDELFWDNSARDYNTHRAADDRDELLKDAVAQDAWIIEGVFHTWVQNSFERADAIVILDTPVWLRHWRILRRFALRRMRGDERARRETLSSLWSLLKWNRAYDGDNLRRARECLQPFAAKVLTFTRADRAAQMLLGAAND